MSVAMRHNTSQSNLKFLSQSGCSEPQMWQSVSFLHFHSQCDAHCMHYYSKLNLARLQPNPFIENFFGLASGQVNL
jgi:hypothetical protein